jgi:arginyl-tRNA synthetase
MKLERSRHEGRGDYSTNAAMLLAPVVDAPPRVIAERIGADLSTMLGDDLERAEVAGPGFLNLFLSDAWHRRALASVLRERTSEPAGPNAASGS